MTIRMGERIPEAVGPDAPVPGVCIAFLPPRPESRSRSAAPVPPDLRSTPRQPVRRVNGGPNAHARRIPEFPERGQPVINDQSSSGHGTPARADRIGGDGVGGAGARNERRIASETDRMNSTCQPRGHNLRGCDRLWDGSLGHADQSRRIRADPTSCGEPETTDGLMVPIDAVDAQQAGSTIATNESTSNGSNHGGEEDSAMPRYQAPPRLSSPALRLSSRIPGRKENGRQRRARIARRWRRSEG